jgi:hypothetical protein
MYRVASKLKIPFTSFKRRAIKLNVWKPNQGAKGSIKSPIKTEDVLLNKVYLCSQYLKVRLLNEGYKEYKCEKCNLTEWQGFEIVLELDHINGNKLEKEN